MNPARLISLTSPRSIDTRDERTDAPTAPARWRPSDVGLALAGLEEPFAAAARFRWARDFTMLPLLERYLRAFADELAARENWPTKLGRHGGHSVVLDIGDLVRLALLEEHYAYALKSGAAYAAFFGIPDYTWHRRLRSPYEGLRGELENWNGIAYAHIARRLR